MKAQQNRQLDDVARRVILPGLKLIQWHCDRQGDSIRLAVGQPTGDAVLDQLLAELPRPTEPRWLIASLRLQPKALPGSRNFFYPAKDRFYLVVEIEIDANKSVRVVPSVFCEYQKGVGFRRFTDEAATILQPVHLLDSFLSYIEALEAKQSATQSEMTAAVSEAPKSKVEPVQPIPATQPIPPPVPEDPYKLAAAAKLELEAAQRKEIEALLKFLGLNNIFKHWRFIDFERGLAWSRKVMGDRPKAEGDYQRAYDALCQQATGFVRSLKATVLYDCANYFELYWTIALGGCLANQGEQPYEVAFMTQVQDLAEPTDRTQVQAQILQSIQRAARSLEKQLGLPDRYGRREYIGSCEVDTRLPMEPLIKSLQAQKVLFQEVSWGILQVFQNAGRLPPSEKERGWSLVACFVRSARWTIRRPTQAVQCNSDHAEFLEFRFERRLSERGIWWAIAVVRVYRGGSGQMVLHTYRFEPDGSR